MRPHVIMYLGALAVGMLLGGSLVAAHLQTTMAMECRLATGVVRRPFLAAQGLTLQANGVPGIMAHGPAPGVWVCGQFYPWEMTTF